MCLYLAVHHFMIVTVLLLLCRLFGAIFKLNFSAICSFLSQISFQMKNSLKTYSLQSGPTFGAVKAVNCKDTHSFIPPKRFLIHDLPIDLGNGTTALCSLMFWAPSACCTYCTAMMLNSQDRLCSTSLPSYPEVSPQHDTLLLQNNELPLRQITDWTWPWLSEVLFMCHR